MNKLYTVLLGSLIACTVYAQPAGWSYVQPLQVQNNTASLVTNYQLMFTFDTQTPIGLGQMNANGDDIRFGKTCAGTTLFNYWIESGINTTTTKFWVKIDSIPASGSVVIYMFYGNASATAASAIPGVFIGPHSSTDSVASGGAGGVGNSQRGFRFAPNEDVLVSAFGKREPTGTTRYVTLFNFTTQAVLSQQQVAGPAAQYSYQNIAQPLWLTTGTQYLLELFQGTGDGYYFGTSSQIGQHLTYYDMRYCNSCTQNTFPTNTLSNYQYGYPDMWYWTKQNIAVAPTVSVTTVVGGTLTTVMSGNTTVCPGDSATVTIAASGGTGVYSYQWIPTTGMAYPTAASTNVLPPTSGWYYCIATDQCGNSNTDSIYVTINTPPTITANVSTDSVCLGGTFIATGGGAVSYSWSGGVVDGLPFTPSATSNYTVTGTDANGCTNIAIAAVEVLPLPSVMAGASATTICAGDSVTLFGIGSATFVWDNGAIDNVPTAPSSNTFYHVVGTDVYGCSNSDSIFITVNSGPTVFLNVTGAPFCSGGSANLSASGAGSFVWNPGSITGSNITVSPTAPTMYYATGTDSASGCSTTDSIFVDVYQNPMIVTTSDTVCSGNCGQLNAIVTGGTPAYTYMWAPATGLSNTTILNPLACDTITMCYTLTVTDANNCSDSQVACNFVDQIPAVSISGPQTACVNDGNMTLFSSPASAVFSGPGMTNNIFSPSTAGVGTHMIVLTYTDPNTGCVGMDSMAIVVSACVGIVDNNANDGIDVYPNPFGNQFTISLTEASHVRMFNNLGQVVFEQEMNTGRNEINTASLPVGVYTLEVMNASGTASIKVVKQ